MDNQAEHIAYLWQRYIAGTASAEELERLLAYNSASGNDDAQSAVIEQLLAAYPPGKVPDEEVARHMLQDILHPQAAVVRPIPLYRRWWAAAVLVLLLTGAGWWALHKEDTPPVVAQTVAGNLQPGMDGAVLTLADGSQLLLDTFHQATVAIQNKVTAKVQDGVLIYEGVGDAVVYNTMSTPKGRQFRLTLPDGTNVWLNAASSIRYPLVFPGNERRVEMTGEAYFEVAKDKTRPFRLNINNKANVEVLGTKFNVNAYVNEEAIHTTLLEGSVRMRPGTDSAGSKPVVLQPGEQVSLSLSLSALSSPVHVNTSEVVAWKDGLFNFNNASLAEVMRQLERWYDITVIYQQPVPALYFGGKISRKVSLQGVLKALEDSKVHFRIEEGRRLVVLP